MPSNIEIKARDPNPAKTWQVAKQLATSTPKVIEQRDTFFVCTRGRLKLRQLSATEGELIFYRRDNLPGTKKSDYAIVPTGAPEELAALLADALGAWQTVVKSRTLFKVGQTRIHLDSVAGLGSFIELEVVLQHGQTLQEGHTIAQQLMAKLGIRNEDLLDCAYADLLARQSTQVHDSRPPPRASESHI